MSSDRAKVTDIISSVPKISVSVGLGHTNIITAKYANSTEEVISNRFDGTACNLLTIISPGTISVRYYYYSGLMSNYLNIRKIRTDCGWAPAMLLLIKLHYSQPNPVEHQTSNWNCLKPARSSRQLHTLVSIVIRRNKNHIFKPIFSNSVWVWLTMKDAATDSASDSNGCGSEGEHYRSNKTVKQTVCQMLGQCRLSGQVSKLFERLERNSCDSWNSVANRACWMLSFCARQTDVRFSVPCAFLLILLLPHFV